MGSSTAEPLRGRGVLIAVTGPGGTGSSATAVALAQGLADRLVRGADGRPFYSHDGTAACTPGAGGAGAGAPGAGPTPRATEPIAGVLLADLARHAELGVLHDAHDLTPGIRDLVEAHRTGRPAPRDAVGLTYDVAERRYHLLLGLARPDAWPTIPPRAFAASLQTLVTAYRYVVCDVTADFEGEAEGGSVDVEERNTMSRGTAFAASAVVAVGRPTRKGFHSLARVVSELLEIGIRPERILPALVGSNPRHRTRADATAALAARLPGIGTLRPPVALPDRRPEAALASGARLHPGVTTTLTDAVLSLLQGDRPASAGRPEPEGEPDHEPEPQRVLPGTLARLRPTDIVFGIHSGCATTPLSRRAGPDREAPRIASPPSIRPLSPVGAPHRPIRRNFK